MIENELRAALIGHLRADPVLQTMLNAVTEEAPSRASPPWLGIAASASTDWSHKTGRGREVRIAFELHARADEPRACFDMANAVQDAVESLPRGQDGFDLVGTLFLRGRVEERPRNTRAMLLEYRFRALAA